MSDELKPDAPVRFCQYCGSEVNQNEQQDWLYHPITAKRCWLNGVDFRSERFYPRTNRRAPTSREKRLEEMLDELIAQADQQNGFYGGNMKNSMYRAIQKARALLAEGESKT